MKITIINGQNHKGSSYHIAHLIAEKLGGEITEFFLPKDFDEFCLGCTNCIIKGEQFCAHAEKLVPITKALDEADLIIVDSPVYVFHISGQLKALLDHYGYRWLSHRPEGAMFTKQAVCICTAAGAGMKSACKDISDSLSFWGIPKVYKIAVAVQAMNWNSISKKKMKYIEKKTQSITDKINKNYGKARPGVKGKFLFKIFGMMQGKDAWNALDAEYWTSRGWNKNKKPW